MSFLRDPLPLVLLAACVALLPTEGAHAGCGCDHPPPNFAIIAPPFASPGKTVQIHPDGFEFVPGESYRVDFGSASVDVAAVSSGVLDVVMPEGVPPGPVEIKVQGDGWDHVYDSHLFTALAPAPVVPSGDGVWVLSNFQMSIAADGTILIPFNVGQILDGTQFAFQIGNRPIEFEHDDVVFYNEDGVDLTLFSLDVDDPTERQWGSYHGWTVEQDNGIQGKVWQRKIRASLMATLLSDTLTYWRHEFHTYKQAHLLGGTHEVGSNGYHLGSGTLHVDHDHLVLAIDGDIRDPQFPMDPARFFRLGPGPETADLYVATVRSENPIEPNEMEGMLFDAILGQVATPMVVESPSAYDDAADDDDDD